MVAKWSCNWQDADDLFGIPMLNHNRNQTGGKKVLAPGLLANISPLSRKCNHRGAFQIFNLRATATRHEV